MQIAIINKKKANKHDCLNIQVYNTISVNLRTVSFGIDCVLCIEKAILAAGSIIQNNEDFDVALVKYRISAG